MKKSDEELIEIRESRQYLHDADSQVISDLVQEILDLRRAMAEIMPLMDRVVNEECGVQPCYSRAIMAKMKIRKLLPKDQEAETRAADSRSLLR